jgi:hypothetical protein
MLRGMTSGSRHGSSRHRRHGHRERHSEELVAVAPFHEVVAAIEAIDLEGPWETLKDRLRLVLPRQRPMPPGVGDLPTRDYPPGIAVGLGLDVGPAMLFVGPEQLRGWGIGADDAYAQAEANLRGLSGARRTFAIVREPIGGVETLAYQSRDGWAGSLVLVPDELSRVLGQRSGLILAPMRDLLMWMPLDTDAALATWVLEELAAADMNALDIPLLALVDSQLTVVRPSVTARARMPSH